MGIVSWRAIFHRTVRPASRSRKITQALKDHAGVVILRIGETPDGVLARLFVLPLLRVYTTLAYAPANFSPYAAGLRFSGMPDDAKLEGHR
ncbi:MAG: hypothetical protein U1F40_15385 [Turneriella sp.]